MNYFRFKLRLYTAPNLWTDTEYSDTITTCKSNFWKVIFEQCQNRDFLMISFLSKFRLIFIPALFYHQIFSKLIARPMKCCLWRSNLIQISLIYASLYPLSIFFYHSSLEHSVVVGLKAERVGLDLGVFRGILCAKKINIVLGISVYHSRDKGMNFELGLFNFVTSKNLGCI